MHMEPEKCESSWILEFGVTWKCAEILSPAFNEKGSYRVVYAT